MSIGEAPEQPAYLKQVLWELLVLQGMDKDLGYGHEFSPYQLPDPMTQARYYLEKYAGPPRTVPVRLRLLGWVLWIGIIGWLVGTLFWEDGRAIHLVFGVIIMASAVLSHYLWYRQQSALEKLKQGNLFDQWLFCLRNHQESIARIYDSTPALIAWIALGRRPKTLKQTLRLVTENIEWFANQPHSYFLPNRFINIIYVVLLAGLYIVVIQFMNSSWGSPLANSLIYPLFIILNSSSSRIREIRHYIIGHFYKMLAEEEQA